MAVDVLQSLEIIEVMENFISRIRPPAAIRDKMDISYTIDDQSITIFELRPHFKERGRTIKSPIAKTTFVKAKNHWKVFWQRADLKWHTYEPKPTVRTLKEFTELVAEDEHHCFFG
jgi:hypothetical protein